MRSQAAYLLSTLNILLETVMDVLPESKTSHDSVLRAQIVLLPT